MFGEEPRPAYDRVQLTSFFAGKSRRGPEPRAEDVLRGRERRRCASDDAVIGDRPRRARSCARRAGEDVAVRRAGARHRLVPVRAAGAGHATAAAASSTAPSTTSTRSAAARATARRSAWSIGGGLLGLEAANALRDARARDPRRRVRAAADGRAGRRGRRRGAAPHDRGARRRGAHRRRARSEIVDGADGARHRAGASPTARTLDDRPGRVLRRHPAARRAGARGAAWRSASAAASSIDDALPHRRPATSTRSASAPLSSGRMLRPRRARLRDGRGRRRPAARRRRRSFAGADMSHQAQAARRRRRQLRRRASARTPGALDVIVFDDPAQASTRSSSSPTTRKTLLGGILVGDASAYGTLLQLALNGVDAARRTPGADPAAARRRGRRGSASTRCPTRRTSARATTSPRATICDAIARRRLHRRRRASRRARKAGTSCGGCVPLLKRAARGRAEAARASRSTTHLCEHFAHSPPGAVRPRPRCSGIRTLRRAASREHGTRPRLRHLQAGRRLDPRVGWQRAHPRRRAGRAAGHQRPLPRQHPEGRHLLGRAAHPRRRDHARAS